MSTALPDPTSPLHFQFYGPIQQRFQIQAAQTPEGCALVCRGEQCSYAELDQLSTRIAQRLSASGIGPGKSVAIYSDRNAALVFAMLGVLKSGAAFFVADAAYPASRHLEFFALAQPAHLLICGGMSLPAELDEATAAIPRTKLPSGKQACLQSLPDAPSRDLVPIDFTRADAYYSFTSGSTGRPKAIVTAHAPLVHFVDWHVQTHGFTSADRFSLLSGLGHDPVLRDIFTPLSIGASLHIPEQSTIFDPFKLARWLDEQAITVLHLTPALGQIIQSGAEATGPLECIRFFFWGGDVLGARQSRNMQVVAPRSRQVNFYGATETPQAMSYYEIEKDDPREAYPIGRGIADVQLLVVHESNRLAQVDELGEIYVRTRYLSRGYLHDAEKTLLAFVANPITHDTHDVCYRTGDLGKYLEDGNVVFAGRNDHQVKIRGYRVELDEIRARIEQQPDVLRSVVLAQDLGRSSKVLVAYFTRVKGTLIDSATLQNALKSLVPGYMVPTYFVRLDDFPLLPNGKIDLRNLPPPTRGETQSDDAVVSPSSERERQLAQIWKELLGVESVGVNESFMDLGGDSLSMIGVLVRMRQLGISEAVARGVIQGKTIAQLVREECGDADPAPAPALIGPARTTLLVNCLRGILVSIVVAGHWFPGFLKRLPQSLGFLQEMLDPLFNIATPGFAVVFGITLGYYYYPKFATNRARVRYMINFGLCLLGAAILIEEVLGVSVQAVRGTSITAHELWISLFGPLLYYFLALLTVPLWFSVIGKFRSEIGACLGLILVCYFVNYALVDFLLSREQHGFLQLVRLMLVAKYAYFNMSIGALSGVALGIYLVRRPTIPWLAGKLFVAALVLGLAGLTYLRLERGSLAALSDADDMGMWRWAAYAAAVLLAASGLTLLLDRYDNLPAWIRRSLNWVGILGQCSLIVYVLHGVVLEVKVLLVAARVPETLALLVPLGAFMLACAMVMSRIYRLYYGSAFADSRT
jgi:amino acid adenylation domain-containing protein